MSHSKKPRVQMWDMKRINEHDGPFPLNPVTFIG
jgi:hypothetical protein